MNSSTNRYVRRWLTEPLIHNDEPTEANLMTRPFHLHCSNTRNHHRLVPISLSRLEESEDRSGNVYSLNANDYPWWRYRLRVSECQIRTGNWPKYIDNFTNVIDLRFYDNWKLFEFIKLHFTVALTKSLTLPQTIRSSTTKLAIWICIQVFY